MEPVGPDIEKDIVSEVVEHRRALHRIAELSFREYKTTAYLAEALSKLQLPYQALAETGLVATVGNGSRCVALRADIDALPITEETGLPFASVHPGVMHACGHDAHAAMLLGAAKILKAKGSDLRGTVKLIFQAGEEVDPGGASVLIANGVLENPRPEVIFAQHVEPGTPCGVVQIAAGAVFASASEVTITIRGKGGHAADPHLTINPILIAASFLMKVKATIASLSKPNAEVIFSVGVLRGGTAENVVPDEVTIEGTVRSFDRRQKEAALAALREQLEGECKASGATCSFKATAGYPPVQNDPNVVRFLHGSIGERIGEKSIVEMKPALYAEDFGFYAEKIPAAMWLLGVRPEGVQTPFGLHTSNFVINENALPLGAKLLADAASNWLAI